MVWKNADFLTGIDGLVQRRSFDWIRLEDSRILRHFFSRQVIPKMVKIVEKIFNFKVTLKFDFIKDNSTEPIAKMTNFLDIFEKILSVGKININFQIDIKIRF